MKRTWRPIRSADPSFEPVTVAQAKAQLGIAASNTDHDTVLTALIKQARERFEHESNYIVATGTFTIKTDDLGEDEIEIPLRPVTSITSITYVDTSGNTQTFSGSKYSLSNSGSMPEIVLGYNESWPAIRGHEDDVTITFVAGHATTDAVPERIRQAIICQVKHDFEVTLDTDTRGSFGFQALTNQFARPTYP